ncbi:unnamed protein product, partial [Owenia fusiformis]
VFDVEAKRTHQPNKRTSNSNFESSLAARYTDDCVILASSFWRTFEGREDVLSFLENILKAQDPTSYIDVVFDKVSVDKRSATGYGQGILYSINDQGETVVFDVMRVMIHFVRVKEGRNCVWKIKFWLENKEFDAK